MWHFLVTCVFPCFPHVTHVAEHCLKFNPVMTKWYATHPGAGCNSRV